MKMHEFIHKAWMDKSFLVWGFIYNLAQIIQLCCSNPCTNPDSD